MREKDSAYYASLAAAKMEDYPSILKYAPYAQDDKEVGKYARCV